VDNLNPVPARETLFIDRHAASRNPPCAGLARRSSSGSCVAKRLATWRHRLRSILGEFVVSPGGTALPVARGLDPRLIDLALLAQIATIERALSDSHANQKKHRRAERERAHASTMPPRRTFTICSGRAADESGCVESAASSTMTSARVRPAVLRPAGHRRIAGFIADGTWVSIPSGRDDGRTLRPRSRANHPRSPRASHSAAGPAPCSKKSTHIPACRRRNAAA